MAEMDRFVGYDTSNNPITEQYHFKGDSRYTARSEEAADMSNWNMMLYQNWYNEAENQLSRLEKAGLNPLYYLGGNAGTALAANGGNAQGHSMTSANGKLGQVIDASRNAADTLLQTQRQAQEYDLATKEMNLKSRELDIQQGRLDLEREGGSDYDKAVKQSQAEKNRSDVGVNDAKIENLGKQNEWTDQQITESKSKVAVLQKEVDTLAATANELNTRAGLNVANTRKTYEEAATIADNRWNLIEKTAAEAGLTKQMYQSEVQKTTNWMLNNSLQKINIKVGNQQYINLKREGDRIEFELNQDKKWNDWERGVKIGTSIVETTIDAGAAITTGGLSRVGYEGKQSENRKNDAQTDYWNSQSTYWNSRSNTVVNPR